MPLGFEKLKSLADQVFDFRQTLTPESDRGCALMAGAFLDYRLKLLIEGSLIDEPKLKKVFLEFSGPAGTFSSRIDFVYLTGLIARSVHSDLHRIRKIRNEFGHRIESIDFTTPEIRQRCDTFQNMMVPPSAAPRLKFTNACFGVLSEIDVAIICQIPLKNKEEKLVSEEEREIWHKDFTAKFNVAASKITEEEVAADPVAAKEKLFAGIVGDNVLL